MNVDDIHDVVAVLLRRLEPVERAELLSDTIEGLHPLARKAAVLIGFFERDGEPTLIFRSEEHTSELQSQSKLVCRLLLEKKKISYFLAVPALLKRPSAPTPTTLRSLIGTCSFSNLSPPASYQRAATVLTRCDPSTQQSLS